MRRVARLLATVAVVGAMGGQAFGQGAKPGVVVVGDAPIHKIDGDAAGPAKAAPAREPLAPPHTLNAQYAGLDTLKVMPLSAGPPEPPAAKAAEPEGPTVAFAPSLIDAAGAFEAYVAKAGGMDTNFADGAAIGKAVTASASYETHQFQEGLVAYAALVALQEPAFVQAVYDLAGEARDRDELADALLADPRAVLKIDGAELAAASVSGVLAQKGADLVKAGQGARKAAYEVQREAWSKEAAPDPKGRLAEAKKISDARTVMSEADTGALIKSLVALRKTGQAIGGRAPAPTPVVVRGLALAALAVLGRAGEEDIESLAPVLTDAKSEDCMKMAKLNLYQCLAVAGPHYEHAFCLGQHALADTGQCVISAAGQSPIPDQTLAAAPVKKSRSVSVPIALTSPAGPERALAYARPEPRAAAAPAVTAEEEEDEAPAPPVRRAQRDDRYAEEEAYGRDPRAYRQDYDPYADPYYGRYPPPGYAYRYGR